MATSGRASATTAPSQKKMPQSDRPMTKPSTARVENNRGTKELECVHVICNIWQPSTKCHYHEFWFHGHAARTLLYNTVQERYLSQSTCNHLYKHRQKHTTSMSLHQVRPTLWCHVVLRHRHRRRKCARTSLQHTHEKLFLVQHST